MKRYAGKWCSRGRSSSLLDAVRDLKTPLGKESDVGICFLEPQVMRGNIQRRMMKKYKVTSIVRRRKQKFHFFFKSLKYIKSNIFKV